METLVAVMFEVGYVLCIIWNSWNIVRLVFSMEYSLQALRVGAILGVAHLVLGLWPSHFTRNIAFAIVLVVLLGTGPGGRFFKRLKESAKASMTAIQEAAFRREAKAAA